MTGHPAAGQNTGEPGSRSVAPLLTNKVRFIVSVAGLCRTGTFVTVAERPINTNVIFSYLKNHFG